MQRFAEDISRRMMYLNNLCPSDLRHGTDLLKSGGARSQNPSLLLNSKASVDYLVVSTVPGYIQHGHASGDTVRSWFHEVK